MSPLCWRRSQKQHKVRPKYVEIVVMQAGNLLTYIYCNTNAHNTNIAHACVSPVCTHTYKQSIKENILHCFDDQAINRVMEWDHLWLCFPTIVSPSCQWSIVCCFPIETGMCVLIKIVFCLFCTLVYSASEFRLFFFSFSILTFITAEYFICLLE